MAVKAVFDCMLFLQAVINENSPAYRCFLMAEEHRVKLQLSPSILSEVNDVLHRRELTNKFRRLTEERVADFLKRVLAFSTLNPEPSQKFTLPRDPDDEPYLHLGIESESNYLVTWNERHLSYLMNADTPEGRDFRQRFPDLWIVSPVQFLSEIEAR